MLEDGLVPNRALQREGESSVCPENTSQNLLPTPCVGRIVKVPILRRRPGFAEISIDVGWE